MYYCKLYNTTYKYNTIDKYAPSRASEKVNPSPSMILHRNSTHRAGEVAQQGVILRVSSPGKMCQVEPKKILSWWKDFPEKDGKVHTKRKLR